MKHGTAERVRDPRLLNRSPNIVAAPYVETRLADYWAQSEVEGSARSLKRHVGSPDCSDMVWPYCEVA